MISLHARTMAAAALLALLLAGAAAPADAGDPMGDALAGEFALQGGDFAAAARHFLEASRHGEDPALAERAAQAAQLAGDAAALDAALERWEQLDPTAPALLATRALRALRAGRPDPARESLARLLALDDADATRQVLQVLASAPDARQSAGVVAELLGSNAFPVEFQAWLAFAGLAQRWGEAGLTDRIVNEAVRRFPDEPRAWLLQASQLRERGDRDGARAAIARVLAAEPTDAGLRIAAAGELERLGDGSGAARILAEGPQDESIYATRAAYLAREEDNAGLADLADEIAASLPDAGAATDDQSGHRLLLGQIAEYLGDFDDALGWYRSIDQGPAKPQAQIREARVLADAGALEDALDVLRGVQLDHEADGELIRDAYLFEADLYAAAGRDVEALSAYGRGLDIFEDDPLLLYARALAWERMDRLSAAEADLRRILAFDPENAAALNALGYTLADRTDRHVEALGYIERALALDPDNPAILDSMGWVLYRLGRLDEAQAMLERAYALFPDPEVAAHLGEVLWQAGERERARAVWAEAEALDPDNRALRRALEEYQP